MHLHSVLKYYWMPGKEKNFFFLWKIQKKKYLLVVQAVLEDQEIPKNSWSITYILSIFCKV